MLPVAVGGVIAAVLIALVAYFAISSNHTTANAQTVSQQYGCVQAEMTTQTHFHTHLAIYVGGVPPGGQSDPIPGQIGITSNGTSNSFCWIHTHDSSGIIHIEAPYKRLQQGFTMNDFLKVWRISNPAVSFNPGPGQKEVVYVDGRLWKGSITSVPLKSLEDVALEILAKDQAPSPPPAFTWPAGFGA